MRSILFLLLAAPLAVADTPKLFPSVSAVQPAPAAPTLTIEAGTPVKAEVGRKCIVEVKTTAKKVTWKVPAEVDTLPIDGKRLAVWAKPGTYTLTAMIPAGDDVLSTEVTLTITGEIPVPGPSLKTDVRAAYDKDTTANKAELVKKLANLYRAAGTVTVKDTSVKTYFDLFTDVSTANAAQMGATDLQSVRVVIAKYLDSHLPTDKTTLIDRAKAGVELLNVATALESIK